MTEIREDDKDFQDYVFTLKDLEFKSSNKWHSKQLKDTVKGLMSKPIEIQKNTNKWESNKLVFLFKYDNGIITCRLIRD